MTPYWQSLTQRRVYRLGLIFCVLIIIVYGIQQIIYATSGPEAPPLPSAEIES